MLKKNRGRPLGFKLSEASKQAISVAKTGQRHSEKTKEKISRTLMAYFRNIHPLSKELYEEYKDLIDLNTDIKEWFDNISSDYDDTRSVFTEKSLNSKRLREVSIEYNIDMSNNNNLSFFATNPEKMCELKLLCEQRSISFKDIVSMVDATLDELDELNELEESNG